MIGSSASWPPEWAGSFCKQYTFFLFSAGKWTLIAGILLGIALAAATIYLLVRKPPATDDVRALVPATGVIDAAKAFLQALSSAPTWLALFGGGVLLLWLAGYSRPEVCPGPRQPCSQTCPQEPRNSSTSTQTSPPQPGNTQ